MSTRLRYSNPQIINHLASQYVLGLQTDTVRRAVHKLRARNSELDKAILTWQAHFNHLDNAIEEVTPPPQVWDRIESELFADNTKSDTATPWYKLPYLWLSMGLSSALTAAFAITLLLPMMTDTDETKSIGYLAVMSAKNEASASIDFVLAAYKGKEAGQSTLHVQWSSDFAKVDTSEWVLTSVEKGSGLVTNLGNMKSVLGRHLTSSEWKAIKNSQSLQIKHGDQVIFEGPCLQLTDWAKREAS